MFNCLLSCSFAKLSDCAKKSRFSGFAHHSVPSTEHAVWLDTCLSKRERTQNHPNLDGSDPTLFSNTSLGQSLVNGQKHRIPSNVPSSQFRNFRGKEMAPPSSSQSPNDTTGPW